MKKQGFFCTAGRHEIQDFRIKLQNWVRIEVGPVFLSWFHFWKSSLAPFLRQLFSFKFGPLILGSRYGASAAALQLLTQLLASPSHSEASSRRELASIPRAIFCEAEVAQRSLLRQPPKEVCFAKRSCTSLLVLEQRTRMRRAKLDECWGACSEAKLRRSLASEGSREHEVLVLRARRARAPEGRWPKATASEGGFSEGKAELCSASFFEEAPSKCEAFAEHCSLKSEAFLRRSRSLRRGDAKHRRGGSVRSEAPNPRSYEEARRACSPCFFVATSSVNSCERSEQPSNRSKPC